MIKFLLSSHHQFLQQTKDEITSAAVMRLREHGLTIGYVIATPEERIAELIKPVGFWRKKAVYLKNTARLCNCCCSLLCSVRSHIILTHAVKLRDEFGSDVPSSIEGYLSLPGVGIKMATIAMNVCGNCCASWHCAGLTH